MNRAEVPLEVRVAQLEQALATLIVWSLRDLGEAGCKQLPDIIAGTESK
jgi:hypothetical protein